MAKNTPKALRNKLIYSIYVRNYSEEGTFDAVRRDLDRIKALGTDIVWLMPIHPIGKKARKGTLGSPYAIQNYREINPEFGTMEDFRHLVDDIHAKGMKCIIDVVYNHTSPDSWLAVNHPEWFYHKVDGSFGNKVGDWSDIIDLDYSHRGLWEYQIETLKMWAKIVDGFRCDVAPMVPLDFWLAAREEVANVRKDCIWLAESMERGFIASNRARGVISHSDCEMFSAFDLSYEYDVYEWCRGYLENKNSLDKYAEYINLQETIYPENYVKLRFLENHDVARAHTLITNTRALVNWTTFLFFQKGATLVYAGQEKGCIKVPSLFEKNPVNWREGSTDKVELTELIALLAQIKKKAVFADSTYHVQAFDDDIMVAVHTPNGNYLSAYENEKKPTKALLGIFGLGNGEMIRSSGIDLEMVKTGDCRRANTIFQDGLYENLIDGTVVEISEGRIVWKGEPIIIEAQK